MAWTTQKTMTTADAGSASDWNTYVRDDVTYLHSGRPHFSIFHDHGANYTTSSATFVDIDATNLTATITITGSCVLVGFEATKSGVGAAQFDITVDGTRLGAAGADGLSVATGDIGGTVYWPVHVFALATGLSVGAHTFRIQWKSASGATLYAGAGSAGTDYIPHFWGIEVA
jgi:hypothetical protein